MRVKKLISSLIAVSVIAGSITIVSASDLKPNQTNEAANAIPSIVSAEFNEQGVNDFVTRLYDICIGRKPDANGLADWTGKLKNGKATGVSVAFGFIFSPEFQGKGYSNDEYVEIMYKAFFGRKSDPGGKADWLSKMNNGMSREDLFFGFANSKEFFNLCGSYGITAGCYIKGKDYNKVAQINLFVNRLYSIVLGRSCDQGGMQDWSNQLASGKISGIEAARGFFFSQEYVNQKKLYSAYISDLYKAFLGRSPSKDEQQSWLHEMVFGATKEHVFNGFALSNEFRGICSSYGITQGGAISEAQDTTNTLKLNDYGYSARVINAIGGRLNKPNALRLDVSSSTGEATTGISYALYRDGKKIYQGSTLPQFTAQTVYGSNTYFFGSGKYTIIGEKNNEIVVSASVQVIDAGLGYTEEIDNYFKSYYSVYCLYSEGKQRVDNDLLLGILESHNISHCYVHGTDVIPFMIIYDGSIGAIKNLRLDVYYKAPNAEDFSRTSAWIMHPSTDRYYKTEYYYYLEGTEGTPLASGVYHFIVSSENGTIYSSSFCYVE